MLNENRKWIFVCSELVKIILIALTVAYLFFDSLIGVVVTLPYLIYAIHKIKYKYHEYLKKRYVIQFRDFLSCAMTALEAGYSFERAIDSSYTDMALMHGKDAVMVKELAQIKRRLELGQTIEEVIGELAERTEITEILDFSDTFGVAKRSGGDILRLTRAANRDLYEKLETKREIDSIISANRSECTVMRFMPLGILLYFRVFSMEFLTPLYCTVAGRVVMILVAGIYFILWEYSGKIVESAGEYN